MLQPVLTLMTITESLPSCDQYLGAWQLAHTTAAISRGYVIVYVIFPIRFQQAYSVGEASFI